jgi:NTP pyrophosphatase (non-canonical NTP hydrolase)
MSYTDEQKDNLYARCIEKWGPQTQATLSMEEAAEFIKAMSKHLRYNSVTTQDDLAEEVCDLRLMLNQVERAYGLRRKVAAAEDWKLQRLEKKLEE